MTEEAAEKLGLSSENDEKHASGAKAHVHSLGFKPGINPRPTARMSFLTSLLSHALLQGAVGSLRGGSGVELWL